MCRNRSRSFRSLSRQAMDMTRATSIPTMPKAAVKMLSMKTFENEVKGAAQPLIKAAVAGLGQVASVTKAGAVLLK